MAHHAGLLQPALLALSHSRITYLSQHICCTFNLYCSPRPVVSALRLAIRMTYEAPSNGYADSRTQFSPDQNQFESHKTRPRASSNAGGDRNMSAVPHFVHPHQPLDEAVTNAVSSADAAHYVTPEIIAQITANVINQLKTTGMNSTTPTPTTQPHFPQSPQPHPLNPQVHQPVPQSPSNISTSPPPMFPRNVYTPPSPHRNAENSGHGSPPPHSAFAQHLPTNPPPNVQSYDIRPSSPLSQASESSCTRPKGPTRLSTSKEETTLEKIWGQLFDEDGHPTPRLGQFLRGLAVHIVCKKNSDLEYLGNLSLYLK